MKDEGYLVLSDLDKINKRSFDQIYEDLAKKQEIYCGIDYARDHQVDSIAYGISLSNAIKHANPPQTKTPTNYWNYFLVGILGAIMLVIGYELHELLPIP